LGNTGWKGFTNELLADMLCCAFVVMMV